MNVDAQQKHRAAIIAATVEAAKFMDCDDLGPDAEWVALVEAENERGHCGVCQVRHVMRIVWPAVVSYLNALESELGLELTSDAQET